MAARWDNQTCTVPIAGLPAAVPQFFVPQVPPGNGPGSSGGGIFSTTNRDNPVRDWNMVCIPYCTGDIHTGSAEKTYTSVGHPVLPVPPGAPITIQHCGFDNFRVVMDWGKRNFDDPKKVLVTGVSAGGYGATANSPWVWRAFPRAQMYLRAHTSQDVSIAAVDNDDPGCKSWNPQLAPWAPRVFGRIAAFAPGCQLLRQAAQGQPKAKVAQFTTTFDDVQIRFYGVMKAFYGLVCSCPNPAIDWYQQMSRQLVSDANDLGNFRFHLAGGSYHTLLRDPTFYTESSAGPAFADWLGDLLSIRGGRNGHGGNWTNAACPTCLVELPCTP